MRCLPATNLDSDVPFWISRISFFLHFDQQDFLCRDVEDVVDAYSENWFYADADGNRLFLIPPVSVRGKVTQFISGRHRTTVLLRHLDNVPLSLDSRFTNSEEEDWIWSMATRPVDRGVQIELPDLPIRAALP